MRPIGYHDGYDKTVGELRVRSFGGGHPRAVEITCRGELKFKITVEACRDLRYMLDQLTEGVDNDLRLRMRSPNANT